MRWLLIPVTGWIFYAGATAQYGQWTLPITVGALFLVLCLIGWENDRRRTR